MKKERVKFFFLSMLPVFILIGCSTIEVSQDYHAGSDFNRLKTYSWRFDQQERVGDPIVDSSLMDERIRRAVDNKLAEKGFQKVQGVLSDFHVAYKYKISRKIYSTPVSAGVGFGHGYYTHHSSISLRTRSEVSEYDEGLLILDFLSPGSDRILWRGKSTNNADIHLDPEKTTKEINQMVGKMLDLFPPGD